MNNFRVSFFKKATEEEGKDELLGYVIVDDFGTSNVFPILAKAFRLASPNCLMADKTKTERV